MPFSSTAYRVLIASPSDVSEERRIASDAIHKWTVENSAEYETVFIPTTWEANVFPGIKIGGRPQEMINEQIVNICDVLVGIFWTRLGTPTGEAESGTAEEIKRFLDAGKHIMLYFSKAPVVQDFLDLEQWTKLKEFESACRPLGIVETYNEKAELSEKIARHLTLWLRKQRQTTPSDKSSPNVDDTSSLNTTKTEAAKALLSQMDQFARRMRADADSEKVGGTQDVDIVRRQVNQLASAMTDYYAALSEFFPDEDLEELKSDIGVVKQQRESLRYITFDFRIEDVWDFCIEVTNELRKYIGRLRQKLE